MKNIHEFNSNQALWIKKAVSLSWFTIVYNLIEGIVSISFGVHDESIALAGFGADSLIEVASAFLILWRFKESVSENRERRATLGIGVLFLILATLTMIASGAQLIQNSHPLTTLPGVLISSLSLSFMFFLWRAKVRVADALDSQSMRSDAECSLACIKLSAVLFAGSLVFFISPVLWWLDSVAALLIAGLIAKEGLGTIRTARSPDFTGGCGCS